MSAEIDESHARREEGPCAAAKLDGTELGFERRAGFGRYAPDPATSGA